MNAQRILGVDPGLASSGWGIVEKRQNRLRHIAHGCIETSAGRKQPERLLHIYRELRSVIETWQPEAGAIEELYFAKNVKSALPVAHARGVLCLAMAESGLNVFEYSPLAIKQAVTGTGGAEKHQVQHMVKLLLALQDIPRPDHAADALSAAICCANSI
ncbi:MAG: crossover junction endodeoxyribonuclease RuvC [Spirochaetaceae bacterium]|jgi:crossover junction endodeoxyribonuclease RuvC|nr:crossover junction endodeoxyribonuclease RuvC [Spirochaetaceae bacterium]